MKKILILAVAVVVALPSVTVFGADAPTLDVVSATYRVLQSRSPEEQRSIYRSLPADLKSGVWKLQLTAFLSTHPELDAQQRAAVNEAIAIIDHGLFDDGLDTAERAELSAKLEAIELRMRTLFSRETAAAAFASFGTVPGTASRGSLNPTDCECAVRHDWCSGAIFSTGTDVCARALCVKTTSGCGLLWYFACDGMCG